MNKEVLTVLGVIVLMFVILGGLLLKSSYGVEVDLSHITIPETGQIVVYGEHWCPYCQSVFDTLTVNHIPFEFRLASENQAFFQENGLSTIPQVFDPTGHYIGGWSEIMEQLDALGKQLIMPGS